MSNIHLYSDQVLDDVNTILCHVRDNGGKASTKFWQNEAMRVQSEGGWGTDVCNIARRAMGREGLIFAGKASEKQMEIFVEQARKQCVFVLHQIESLREGRSE